MLYFQKNNIKFYNNKHKLFSQTYNSIIFKFKITFRTFTPRYLHTSANNNNKSEIENS